MVVSCSQSTVTPVRFLIGSQDKSEEKGKGRGYTAKRIASEMLSFNFSHYYYFFWCALLVASWPANLKGEQLVHLQGGGHWRRTTKLSVQSLLFVVYDKSLAPPSTRFEVSRIALLLTALHCFFILSWSWRRRGSQDNERGRGQVGRVREGRQSRPLLGYIHLEILRTKHLRE